jgi:hypothetical protein
VNEIGAETFVLSLDVLFTLETAHLAEVPTPAHLAAVTARTDA